MSVARVNFLKAFCGGRHIGISDRRAAREDGRGERSGIALHAALMLCAMAITAMWPATITPVDEDVALMALWAQVLSLFDQLAAGAAFWSGQVNQSGWIL